MYAIVILINAHALPTAYLIIRFPSDEYLPLQVSKEETTLLICVSIQMYTLPPMIVFTRDRVSEALKTGAHPGSMVAAKRKGWITAELYLKWFRYFLEQIPPARPVLLIRDGCSSHISMELIKLAKVNLLYLPSHTTHVLRCRCV